MKQLTKTKLFYTMIFFLFTGAGIFLGNKFITPKQSSVLSVSYVALEENKALPDIVRIPTGSFVQFNTKDNGVHSISQGHGNAYGDTHEHDFGLESGTFGPDQAYRVRFTKVGIYDFHDHLHPDIHATIIVYNPSR